MIGMFMNECIDSTIDRIHVCLLCYLLVTIRGLVGPSNWYEGFRPCNEGTISRILTRTLKQNYRRSTDLPDTNLCVKSPSVLCVEMTEAPFARECSGISTPSQNGFGRELHNPQSHFCPYNKHASSDTPRFLFCQHHQQHQQVLWHT